MLLFIVILFNQIFSNGKLVIKMMKVDGRAGGRVGGGGRLGGRQQLVSGA